MKKSIQKVKVIRECCFHDDPYEGNSSDSVNMKVNFIDNTEESTSVRVREGEPEDMIFGRNLSNLYSVLDMIKFAHEAGKQGIAIEFETIDELEDE